jgi:hypothetical protein
MRSAAFVFLLFVILAPAVNADTTTISAPFMTVGVGNANNPDIFTVPISITGAPELTSWQFDLAFNPAIVQGNSVTEGPFMSAFGATMFIPGVIDNGTGVISLVSNYYVDLAPNPSGTGVLAYISFTALASGVSALTLSNVFLNDGFYGDFNVDNGQITVTGDATVPEPSTLALLAGGLALLVIPPLARCARRKE